MGKLLISDTCDAVIKRKSDGHVVATAETTTSAISQSLGVNERIWAGISSKPVGIIRGQKEVTTNFTNAMWNLDFLAMTQGVAVQEDGSIEVEHREDGLTVTDNAGTLEVTITGTPVGSTVYVVNEEGETESASVATQTVTVPTGHAEAGDVVSVIYTKSATGDIVSLETDKFSEAHEIHFNTIGYNPDTNEVVADIYIQLDHVLPSGDFEFSFENGSAISPEMNFDALTPPNSKEIGRIAQVARA